MARSFDGVDDRVYINSNLGISGVPFTMACWFKPINATNYGVLMALNRTGNSLHMHALSALGDQPGDPIEAVSGDSSISGAWSGIGYTAGSWHHAAGVWTSTNNRSSFCNGLGKATNTALRSPSSLAELNIGSWRGASGFSGTNFNGLIAIPAIWNVALTDAEIQSLASGYRPDQVRPQNLVSYNLFDPRNLDVLGNSWTNSGSIESEDHPPLR